MPRREESTRITTHVIIDGLREKIWHLHVHDLDPPAWQERRPMGTGLVDDPWPIAKRRQIGCSGPSADRYTQCGLLTRSSA